MNLTAFFKSIIDQDNKSVVICDLDHTIIYMNPAAISNYSKRGGAELIGKNLLNCHNMESCEKIKKVIAYFEKDKNNNIVHTFYNTKENKDVYMVALRDENGILIGYYEKHEYRGRDMSELYGNIL